MSEDQPAADAPQLHPDFVTYCREQAAAIKQHDHPKGSEDWFCWNITSYMGERVWALLEHIDALEQRIHELEEGKQP